MCPSTSAQVGVRWHAQERIFDAKAEGGGDWIDQPVGDLCEDDGVTVETYVPMTLEQIRDSIVKSAEFRKGYMQTKKGVVSGVALVLQKQEHVLKQQASGIQVERRLAFITNHQYKIHFGLSPGDPGCTAPPISLGFMLGKHDEAKQGTVLELSDIPPQLPFELVKI